MFCGSFSIVCLRAGPMQTVLTLANSQHQLHGFGSAHSPIRVIEALQQACRGGWDTEKEKACIKAQIV